MSIRIFEEKRDGVARTRPNHMPSISWIAAAPIKLRGKNLLEGVKAQAVVRFQQALG